ncbi:MAG: hypothetical protein HS111_17765 [Kofleriaceae bacterium]|nr:hypothetical protein [Kofleriaceae bacterium]MCL4224310.1 hypothetical protein [Myxococcales bacterium]
MKRLPALLLAAACAAPFTACTAEDDLLEGEIVKDEDGKTDTSAAAIFIDLEFAGELVTDSTWNTQQLVKDQLLYTIGLLNGKNSVGRLDKVVLSDVQATPSDGRTKVTYRAKMPVAWGDKRNPPSSVKLVLPRDMSYQGLTRFAADYGTTCVDWGAHDVDSGSMWYYYRPERSGCRLADDRVVRVTADASLSAINTTGMFPEYHKIWEDQSFNVVAIFGKYEDGATSGDAGIDAYNRFVATMKTELGRYTVTSTPASVPSSPGVGTTDIEWVATLPGGRTIRVNALLTDNVRTALNGTAFRTRYEALSTRADLIVYNGHAGLGANVRALARAGKWVPGQYMIMFENGCDTYAYVDGALAQAHAEINPDDPDGTKYVDIVTNAMPAYFSSMPNATMALFRGLAAYDAPRTYEQIFAGVDRSQVVLVTGEQDNTFTPGGGGQPQPWAGLADSGTVTKNQVVKHVTPTLAAGTYVFELTGTADADLYVRVGSEPTTATYDCRPYKASSNETCEVKLAAPAAIHVHVRGYAASSTFELAGRPR